MIDLNSIEVVAFDFDDTLCIHRNHSYDKSKEAQRLKLGSAFYYDKSSPNKHMKKFIEYLNMKGVVMCLLSATSNYKSSEIKIDWVKEEYGVEMSNWCVGTTTSKLDCLSYLTELYKSEPDKVLIVDDRYDVLELAEKAGYQAATPMEVVNIVEEMNLNV